MAVLDDLSGFEFEDVIEDVFRNLGYENVRQAERTADEGRDVIMEEVVDGTRRAIIVECKHTGTVGRPVVQKLHSAIATFDFDGPKRGMVVTTGRFTNPAQEYADRLQQNDDPHPIELLDGEDLREIADEIGLDLYNGRIEILCDETLRPYDPAADVDAAVAEAFRDIENIEAADLPDPHSSVTFRPVVAVTADTNAVFETSVGVIHRINDRTRFVAHAERGQPQVVDEDVATLVTENLHATVDLDAEQSAEVFDDVEENRFDQTQTEYKEWAVERPRAFKELRLRFRVQFTENLRRDRPDPNAIDCRDIVVCSGRPKRDDVDEDLVDDLPNDCVPVSIDNRGHRAIEMCIRVICPGSSSSFEHALTDCVDGCVPGIASSFPDVVHCRVIGHSSAGGSR